MGNNEQTQFSALIIEGYPRQHYHDVANSLFMFPNRTRL